jgi:hypothetical protein
MDQIKRLSAALLVYETTRIILSAVLISTPFLAQIL